METRPAREEDAAAVAELFGSVEEALLGRRSSLDENEVLGWWQGISFDTNTWLVEDGGTLVAAAGASQRPGERGVFMGAVRPSAQGRGLGTRLAGLAENRLVEQGSRRIHAWALAADTRAAELFAALGYRDVRRFWEMAIELEEEPPVPDPAVPVETFREEDVRAFHAALEEAFEDHWDNQPRSFDEWWERHRNLPGYDPDLWFLIRVGDEVAAAVLNHANRLGGGHVGVLGVRRRWRGRGYGRALLLRSFREFRRRGLKRASLGVDAANPTGATKLYESVGMHVEQENVVWQKAIA